MMLAGAMRRAACWSLCVVATVAAAAPASAPRPWMDKAAPPSARAAKLIAAMDPHEKLVLLQGAGGPGIGNTAPIERLGVPELHLEDGPNGVADWQVNVTTWPSSMTMAASWDTQRMKQYGVACGAEQRGKGMQVMLGPGVNLARVPVGGRNFEYLGEDPVLAGQLAAAETRGIQSEGVVACVKHWVDNNQEGPGHNGRLSTSSEVSDRANFELYYPPFEAAIDAGVGSAMCSCEFHLAAAAVLPLLLRAVRWLTGARASPHRQSRQRHILVRKRAVTHRPSQRQAELQRLGRERLGRRPRLRRQPQRWDGPDDVGGLQQCHRAVDTRRCGAGQPRR
jgi:hypothetical protein